MEAFTCRRWGGRGYSRKKICEVLTSSVSKMSSKKSLWSGERSLSRIGSLGRGRGGEGEEEVEVEVEKEEVDDANLSAWKEREREQKSEAVFHHHLPPPPLGLANWAGLDVQQWITLPLDAIQPTVRPSYAPLCVVCVWPLKEEEKEEEELTLAPPPTSGQVGDLSVRHLTNFHLLFPPNRVKSASMFVCVRTYSTAQ